MSIASDNLARFRKESATTGKLFQKGVAKARTRYTTAIGDTLRKGGVITSKLLERRRLRELNLSEMQQRFVASTSKVLSPEALKQLADHSKISAPTLTSIFSGYEHARASEAARQQIFIKDTERKLLRNNAADVISAEQQRRDLATARQMAAGDLSADLKAVGDTSRRADRVNDSEFRQEENIRTTDEGVANEQSKFERGVGRADEVYKRGRADRKEDTNASNSRADEVYKRGRVDRKEDTNASNSRADTVYERGVSDRREDATTAFGRRDKGKKTTALEATLRGMAKARKDSAGTTTVSPTGVPEKITTPAPVSASAPVAPTRDDVPTSVPSTIPSFKDLLFEAEAGGSGYQAFNRGNAGDSLGESMDFSKLTLGQIKQLQALPVGHPDKLTAVGAYQIIPSTLIQITESLGISDKELLTDDLQDELLVRGLIPKQPELLNYLISDKDLGVTSGALGSAKEWAGFADPSTGLSMYGEVGSNKARVLGSVLDDTLIKLREHVRAAMAAGASQDEALLMGVTGNGSFDSGKVRVEPEPVIDVPPTSTLKDTVLDRLAANPDDQQAKDDMVAVDTIERLGDGNTSELLNIAMIDSVASATSDTPADQFDTLATDDEKERLAELKRARTLYDGFLTGDDYDTFS